MDNKQNIRYTALLKSKEYKKELGKLLSEIKQKCKKAKNEATISSFFENSIYFFIKSFFGKDIEFVKEKKVGDSVRHIFSNKRMDVITHNLIIEYKHNSKLLSKKDIKKANEQTIGYLKAQLKSKNDYEAILTDGLKIKFFSISENNIKEGILTNININSLDRVIKNLLFVNRKKLASSNLAIDFSINSQNKLSKNLAVKLFNSIKNENVADKTNMLFNEWRGLFHLSESDKGKNQDIDKRRKELSLIFDYKITNNDLEYKALFCLQTTYAIIIKLIALKALNQITLNNKDKVFENLTLVDSKNLKIFFQQLEDGYTFKNIGIRNLLEGEFFAWYCDDNQWDEDIFLLIKNLIDILNSYIDLKFTESYKPQDLFKELYLETIPRSIRHSLGEYFTPSWLADSVITNSLTLIKNDNWRGLDPCCGSGIFLIKLIDKIINDTNSKTLSQKDKRKLLHKILTNVQGIDLNPLSVLTARVNYYIAISNLVEDGDEIEIPIYLGDSANRPVIVTIGGVNCYSYDIETQKQTIKIELPISFIKSKNFSKIMFSIQSLVKAEQPKSIADKILSTLPKNEKNQQIIKKIEDLSKTLITLHKNKWDGIWVRIIYNFLSTTKLGLFDIIVGNPPWVKWEFLPQVYANKIKKICLDKHLFSGKVRTGGISLNICALISNTVATERLTKNGVLAFLMPKTLMTQQSYEGFRNFYLDKEKQKRLYIQKIDDWSNSGNPFIIVQEKFLTYFFRAKKVDYYHKGFIINKYNKKRNVSIIEINAKKDFDSVQKFFELKQNKAKQLNPKRTNFTFISKDSKHDFSKIIGENFYKARSGAEFTPAEIYFIKSVAKTNNQKTHFFKNIPLKISKYKVVPKDKLQFETRYIYPIIKGPNIKPFYYSNNQEFAIFPYKWENKECISFEKLNKECPRVSEYLIDYKSLIEQQSKRSLDLSLGNEFFALSKIGDYTFVDVLVAFRDNTKLCATVIQKSKTPWGTDKMPVCAKHAPYISMTKNKRPITLDEAYYLCGILNTNIVMEYIAKSSDSRSFSIDLPIKIPEFDINDNNFKQISKITKETESLAKLGKEIKSNIDKIERLYLKICEYKK